MIQIKNVSKSFGQRTLFDQVNFVVGPRERIGLVGRNGTGKSTLLRMIQGDMSLDEGEISIPKGYRIGSLDQHLSFEQQTVVDEVVSGLPKEEQMETYRAEKILFGLGFNHEDLRKDPHSFSGGFQIRINLAKVLITHPSLLLLDEPTNYLDIVSLRWLKRFLKQYPGEVLLITHDRNFMDEVVTHVAGIHRGSVKKVKGHTEQFYSQVALDEEIYEKTRLNQEKKRKELEGFVDRFGAKASKAKQAQSRVKQLAKMEILDELGKEAQLGLKFYYQNFTAKNMLEVNNLSFSYTGREEDNLISNLSFTLGKNERLGIIGKNGKGKSTLLNLLAGELKPTHGEVKEHPSIQKGHFGQTNINRLGLKNTIAQEIQSSNPNLGQTEIRSICGSMMFPGDDASKLIEVLSGGERSRVMLGKIIAHPTNILLLDEPTNHLDMETIEVLADEIERFKGAVVIVTHSEALLKRVTNRLVVFRNNGAEYFWGSYSDFLEKIGWDEETSKERPEKPKKKRLSKSERANLVQERSKKLAPIREKIQESENAIEALENLQQKFEDLLQGKVSKGEDVRETSEKIGEITKKIEDLFFVLEDLSVKELDIKNEYASQLGEDS